MGERVAVIRTSDRNSYRNCRRSWNWRSHLRQGLRRINEPALPLWLGTGFHYAMEDYHGLKTYEHPRDAWLAYYEATARTKEQPAEAAEAKDLVVGMLEYYADEWLTTRDAYTTYMYKGRPAVELNWEIDITDQFDLSYLEQCGYDRVIYVGTFDRVVIDSYGFLRIVDYKTAARMDNSHLANDAQCTAYIWAGKHLFEEPVVGMVYQQHLKQLPELPTILKSGSLSVNKAQNTTPKLYRETMIALYGSVEGSPDQVKALLGTFMRNEDEHRTKWISRDFVERSPESAFTEGEKIKAEVAEMINPDLALYPNPNKFQCGWCDFKSPCVDFDEGTDAEHMLSIKYEKERSREDRWRMHLNQPQQGNEFLR